ncbi:hypothetical protein ACFWJW_03850 [Streptomyces sp. NPDC127097]|uniref:hypothetical protein n=1 Tax=Streptomyces sp. NPDC127097 TaxID=3347136 RepID=UPI0036551F93
MTANRRTFLGTALAAGALSALPGTAAAATGPTGPVPSTGTHVITLGTQAGPTIRGPRNGIATALVVDGSLYLFDCGLGLTRQMNSAGVDVSGLRAVLRMSCHALVHIARLPSKLVRCRLGHGYPSSVRSRSAGGAGVRPGHTAAPGTGRR